MEKRNLKANNFDKDNEINGNYYIMSDSTNTYNGIPLFFSK